MPLNAQARAGYKEVGFFACHRRVPRDYFLHGFIPRQTQPARYLNLSRFFDIYLLCLAINLSC